MRGTKNKFNKKENGSACLPLQKLNHFAFKSFLEFLYLRSAMRAIVSDR